MTKPHHACGHDHGPATLPEDLEAASAIAKARAEKAGLRWTSQRQRALELLLQAGKPVKAYDMLAEFQPDGQTAPPTVYRALDVLVGLGLAHRIASLNAYVACHRAGEGAHAASFLFCDCCGGVEEFDAPTETLVAGAASQTGFDVRAISIEAHGLCAACQADPKAH